MRGWWNGVGWGLGGVGSEGWGGGGGGAGVSCCRPCRRGHLPCPSARLSPANRPPIVSTNIEIYSIIRTRCAVPCARAPGHVEGS